MRARKLGPLDVSVVGLGCNNFGGRIDEEATRPVVDAALDAGVTFFDTADTYGNRGGSEEILGRLLRGRRDRVMLATKWGKPMGDGAERRGARDYVERAVEASLRRLQTDVIDLYQHHEEDPGTPLEETVDAVEALVRAGKIRAWGTSNYRPETLERVKALASEAYVSEQGEYSWLRRDAEAELLPACERLGLGFIPFFPLASGLLTGKVSRDEPPAEGTRLHGRAISDNDLDRVERLRAWAVAHERTLLEVAIGGLAAVSPVASVIAGATKPEQVRANAAAGEWEPTADELAELRQVVSDTFEGV
jgi:aryl-alcohol dehydrogenase-like predicted oxidoreductase